jgi:hypothetical protein
MRFSKQIRQLETTLKVTLFDRERRSSVREVSTRSCSPALRGRRVAVKLALGIGKPTLT